MAAHQAPLSLGFSRQEYWRGLPFPSPMHACMHAKSLQSCLSLRPHRRQPTRLLCPGILQARILERVAISFSAVGWMQYFQAVCVCKVVPDTGMTWAWTSEELKLQNHSLTSDSIVLSSPRSSLVVTFRLYVLRLSKHIHCRRST